MVMTQHSNQPVGMVAKSFLFGQLKRDRNVPSPRAFTPEKLSSLGGGEIAGRRGTRRLHLSLARSNSQARARGEKKLMFSADHDVLL